MNNNDFVDNKLKVLDRTITRVGQYVNNYTKIEWTCNSCNNTWLATPDKILNALTGCPKCCGKERITNEKVDVMLAKLNLRRTSNVLTINDHFMLVCNTCQYMWHTNVRSFRSVKYGCPRCANREPSTNDKLDKIIAHKTFVRIGDVVNAKTPIEWKCNICNTTWKTTPNRIISHKTECPKCCNSRYSRKAIVWLEYVMNINNIHIQHAGNGGEYSVPDTKYRVDGFCKETNTIYEFYGDRWHGNPNVFSINEHCHPFSDVNAGVLYNDTLSRETVLRNKGYNVVSMWEQEWDNVQSSKT